MKVKLSFGWIGFNILMTRICEGLYTLDRIILIIIDTYNFPTTYKSN